MKRLCLLLIAPAIWLTQLNAQPARPTQLVVAAGHTTFFPRPGVSAAYSMDANIVQAEAVAGGFQLTGNAAGQTTIMLIAIDGVHTVDVMVPAPRLPAGAGGADGNFNLSGETVEFGQYEVRYNNDPTQITNVQNVTQIAGDRQIHIQIMNADIFPSEGESPIGFPLLSYEISRPGQRITLVDEMMENTDLTMNGILLRGIHLEQGKWEFHAGITSITEFQDFLLPSTRYEVAGISRHFELSKRTLMEANLYYFNTNTSLNSAATPGPMATLYYKHQLDAHTQISAEFGAGRGVAMAGKFLRDGKTQQIEGDFHYMSPNAASLNLNVLHGRLANFMWERKVGKRSQTQFYGNDTDINLAADRQTFDTATLDETYWMSTHIGATAGLTASRFISVFPVAAPVRSFGYLGGPELQWKHFGGAFTFQELHNSDNTPSSTSYQVSAQAMAGSVSTSVFYDLQSETPVFAPAQSTQPALQQMLRYESELARNPAQMIALLHQTSALATQGYVTPMTVTLAASRQQYGSTVDWASTKAGHLTFNALMNTSTGGGAPDVRLETGGVMWTRHVGQNNLLNAGFSIYRSASGGPATLEPIEQISLRHQMNSVPRWMVPGRRAAIQGHVFVDEAFAQDWQKGDTPLQGVLVYLDGRRSTHTDKDGYYTFHGVPFGEHRVEADYHDTRAFFFTSSSPKSVASGDTADFGISFAKGRMFGKFTDDAGGGLAVGLVIEGHGVHREVTTLGDGTLEVDGLPDGTFVVHPEVSTLPPGYSIADIDDLSVQVGANQAGHFHFVAQAQRSIAGVVQVRDSVTGAQTPLSGAEVVIAGTPHVAHTDPRGRYLFRQLPAGSVTVTVMYEGKPYTRSVLLSSAPDVESDADIVISKASPAPNGKKPQPQPKLDGNPPAPPMPEVIVPNNRL